MWDLDTSTEQMSALQREIQITLNFKKKFATPNFANLGTSVSTSSVQLQSALIRKMISDVFSAATCIKLVIW